MPILSKKRELRQVAGPFCAAVGLFSILAGCHRATAVDALARRQMQELKIPGLALVVVKDGEVLEKKAYGKSNVELGVAVSTHTVFQIASTTKIITAIALGMLEQEKKLSITDKVGAFLPNLPADWKDITLEELAAHVSGLPDIIDSPNAPLSADFLKRSERDSLAYAQSMPILSKPGETFHYDQTNFVLLREVIEKVAGMPLQEFAKKRIFEPTGMVSSSWGDARAIVNHRATLYSTVGAYTYKPDGELSNSVNPYVYPEYMAAAAGLNTSVDDLARFAVALYKNELLTSGEAERIWAPARHRDASVVDIAAEFEVKGTLSPTVGWFRLERPGGAHPTVFMEGGSSTAFMYFPKDKLAVAILTNEQGADPVTLAESIAANFLPDLQKVF